MWVVFGVRQGNDKDSSSPSEKDSDPGTTRSKHISLTDRLMTTIPTEHQFTNNRTLGARVTHYL